MDLPGRLTATGGPKLTDCVYSLLTSIRVGLSSLPEHVRASFTLSSEVIELSAAIPLDTWVTKLGSVVKYRRKMELGQHTVEALFYHCK